MKKLLFILLFPSFVFAQQSNRPNTYSGNSILFSGNTPPPHPTLNPIWDKAGTTNVYNPSLGIFHSITKGTYYLDDYRLPGETDASVYFKRAIDSVPEAGTLLVSGTHTFSKSQQISQKISIIGYGGISGPTSNPTFNFPKDSAGLQVKRDRLLDCIFSNPSFEAGLTGYTGGFLVTGTGNTGIKYAGVAQGLSMYRDVSVTAGKTYFGWMFPRKGEYPVRTTVNGGTDWGINNLEETETLNDVFFLDAAHAWLVGPDKLLYYTVDGGETWTKGDIGVTQTFYSLFFLSATEGFICGSAGKIRKTTDGGATWSNTTTPVSVALNNMYMRSTSLGWAVGAASGGAGTILKYNGSSWSSLTSGASGTLNGVFFTSDNDGWAVGTSSGGGNGIIFKTTDGGTNWTSQNVGVQTLNKVFFIGSTGFACGNGGVIYKTTDGDNWSLLTSGTSQNLNDIYFISSNTGWAVGNNGVILKTTNGSTWATQTSGASTKYNAVAFIDSNTGFITGASVTGSGNIFYEWRNNIGSVISSGTTTFTNTVFANTPRYFFTTGGTTNKGVQAPVGAVTLRIGVTNTSTIPASVFSDDWVVTYNGHSGNPAGTKIAGITLKSTFTKDLPTRYAGHYKAGILASQAVTLEDLDISGFRGDGIQLNGEQSEYYDANCNKALIKRANCTSNGRNGVHIQGSRANAIEVYNVDAAGNGGTGFWDQSGVGNLFIGCHASSNCSYFSLVTYTDGLRYAPIVDSVPAGTLPTDLLYWDTINTCSNGFCNPSSDYPAWSNTRTYYLTANVQGLDNAQPTFIGTYIEQKPFSHFGVKGGVMFGAKGQPQWTGSSGVLASPDRNSFSFDRQVGFKRGTFESSFSESSSGVNSDEGTLPTVFAKFTTGQDLSPTQNSLRLVDIDGGYSFTHGTTGVQNTTMTFMNAKNTTINFGRSTPAIAGEPYFPKGLFVGGQSDSNSRKVEFRNATPTTDYHAAGEIVFNCCPSTGEPIFWYCTVSGTPGTWIASTQTVP